MQKDIIMNKIKFDKQKRIQRDTKGRKGIFCDAPHISYKGSLTVEAALLMPLVGMTLIAGVLALFYFHDKNILASCAYETAVVGSTKAREKDGVTPEVLNQAFQERIKGKCILFSGAAATVEVGEDMITVSARAAKSRLKASVEQTAAVTEPETYIRDMRRLKTGLTD